jgi:hypothetical protein
MAGWRRWIVVLVLVGIAACERAPSSEQESPTPSVAATPPAVTETERAVDPPIEHEAPKRASKPKRRKLSSRVEPATTSELGGDALEAEPRSCCKYCSKGKACGNSCIAASKSCHKGVGCACDR